MSFDLLAPHYRWMEFILAGDKLQRCRTRYLASASRVQRVLILGEGNGRFLAECRRELPGARLTCVDASAQMLWHARRRVLSHGLEIDAIDFVQADALNWSLPKDTFDLIVTHFFLDCFRADQLERLIPAVASAARPRAAWLLADFQYPDNPRFSRLRARLILQMMYLFFRVVSRLPARNLASPDAILEGSGFALRERSVTEWGLLHSDWWQRGAGPFCGGSVTEIRLP